MTKRTEHSEQCAVIDWARTYGRRWPEAQWIFAIPNAAKRSRRHGARMKAEGLLPGVSDLFLPALRGQYGGMFIEMKIDNKKATKSQQRFIDKMNQLGYKAIVCWGADEAIRAITDYLDGELE